MDAQAQALSVGPPTTRLPTCRACPAVLAPMRAQGNPRTFCSNACREWSRVHPGAHRSRPTDDHRTHLALVQWATAPWEPADQPWPWLVYNARALATRLLEISASKSPAPSRQAQRDPWPVGAPPFSPSDPTSANGGPA